MKSLQRYFLVGLFSVFLCACQDDGDGTRIRGGRFIVVSSGDSESIMSLYEYSGHDLCVKTLDFKAMQIEGDERIFKDIEYRNNFVYTLNGRIPNNKITQINIGDNFSSKTIQTAQFSNGYCIAPLEDGLAYITLDYDPNISRSYPAVKLYDAQLAFKGEILLDSMIYDIFDACAVGNYLFLNVAMSDISRVDIIDLKSNKVVRKIETGGVKAHGKFSFSDGLLWGSDGYSINPSTFELTKHQFYATNYSESYYVSPLLATREDKVYCFQQTAQPALPYHLYAYNISAQEGKYIGDFHDDHFQPPIVYQSNCDVLISKGNTNELLVYQTDGTVLQRILLPYSDVRTIFFLD